MATTAITPRIPSGSTNGRGILVTATATPGTAIHTATSTSGELDEITIYASNDHTADILLTVELGGTTDPNDVVRYTVPSRSGMNLIVSGHRLNGGVAVAAFAATGSKISIWAEVTRIATS